MSKHKLYIAARNGPRASDELFNSELVKLLQTDSAEPAKEPKEAHMK